MIREKPSTTSFISVTDSQMSQTAWTETGAFYSPGRKFMKDSKFKLKLIALYADHQCLWNECHKDFFNFHEKAKIWEAIADEMKRDSPPGFWKHELHKIRYSVDLEHVREQLTKSEGEMYKSKLFYRDSLNFLNRRFSQEKHGVRWEIPLPAPYSAAFLEKLPSQQASSVKEKPKSGTKLTEKMETLGVLRNHHCSHLVLSHEAFQKMQNITSGVDHLTPKPKSKRV